MKFLISYLRLI